MNLTSNKNKAQQDKTQLMNQIRELDINNNRLKETIDKLTEENSLAEGKNKEYADTIIHLNDKLNDFQIELDNLNSKCKEYENRLGNTQAVNFTKNIESRS